jgi:hypothetical protein
MPSDTIKQIVKNVDRVARLYQKTLNEKPSDISRDVWLMACVVHYMSGKERRTDYLLNEIKALLEASQRRIIQ